MTPTTRHQQLILLDHEKAKLLDELSAETRIAKQVLLREAVDDLLSKHRKGTINVTYVRLRAALKEARKALMAYRRDIVERKAGIVPLQDCDRAIERIDVARGEIGDSPVVRRQD